MGGVIRKLNPGPGGSSLNILGLEVEFAPKDIPWERRAQTLGALAVFILTLGMAACFYPFLISVLSILVFFQCYGLVVLIYTFIIIPYLIWMLYLDVDTPNRGGIRSSKFVRSWSIWKHFNDYFPIKLVKTVDLDPTKNYLFGDHPHGLICSGVFGCFATDRNETQKMFPGFKFSLLTYDPTFFIPFARDIFLLLGLCSASRKSMNCLLSQPGGGHAGILMPGGAPEVFDLYPKANIVQLKERKGFVKVALQNGASLVPVFSFGENQVYRQLLPNPPGSLLRTLQDTLQKVFIVPFPIFYGRGIFQYTLGLLPKRHPITVVVGAPIPVKKVPEPTPEQIDELHEKYVAGLKELFDTHKDKYSSMPNDQLIIT